MKIFYITENKCVDITPHVDEKTMIKILLAAGFTVKMLNNPTIVFAEAIAKEVAKEAIKPSVAVQPLIDILVDLAEPVSYGFMVKGFLQWMAGKENEGKKTIKASSAGYLGVQFIPQIFKIIKTINLGG